MSRDSDLLTELGIHPILMEIGATDQSQTIWDSIARNSIYIGVGRDLNSKLRNGFYQAAMLDEVVSGEELQECPFYLAEDPIYSGILRPTPNAVADFIDLSCATQGETSVQTTTIASLMNKHSLARVDWLYTNVNGVDFRILRSIPDGVRQRILALDTCLDFMSVYEDQDPSVESYQDFVRDGFWLSSVFPHGPVKMQRASLRRLADLNCGVDESLVSKHHKRMPGWLFARFLRTSESMAKGDFSERDYVLLWTFALMDRQFGFAADMTSQYERVFGSDKYSRAMLNETITRLKRLKPRLSAINFARRVLPNSMRHRARRLLFGY